MSKSLFVAEKPSVAQDIAAILRVPQTERAIFENEEWVITSCGGHFVKTELPAFANQQLPLFYDEVYTPIQTEFALNGLKRLEYLFNRKDITTLINGCDSGREGEAIFGYIYRYLECKKPVKRFWCTDQSEEGMRFALKNLQDGEKFIPMFQAASCRNMGDGYLGVNCSRATGKNVGRVKTPTLKFVVDAYRAHTNFKPQDYWEMAAVFNGGQGEFEAKLYEDNKVKRFDTHAEYLAMAQKFTPNQICKIEDVATETQTAPPTLFDTTEAVKQAFRKFGYDLAKTEKILQELYDVYKVTTYPRTDFKVLPKSFAKPKDAPQEDEEVNNDDDGGEQTATSNIRMERVFFNMQDNSAYGDFAMQILQSGAATNGNLKNVYVPKLDGDHYAIIPTGVIRVSGKDYPIDSINHEELTKILPVEHFKVYDLIVRRTLAAFMPSAVYGKTQRTITMESGEIFKTTGRVLLKQGWLAVYGNDEDETDNDEKDGTLTPLDGSGNGVYLKDKEIKSKTKAPPLLNQASLIELMKNAGSRVEDKALSAELKKVQGIGTGATRPKIIAGLLQPDNENTPPYMEENSKKQLIPTKTGIELIEFLKEIVPDVTRPDITAEWETMLGEIEQKRMTKDEFMNKLREHITKLVADIQQHADKLPQQYVRVEVGDCPHCKAGKVVQGKYRYACENKCGLEINREFLGVQIDEKMACILLEEGSYPRTLKMTSKSNKTFQARLKLGYRYDKEGNPYMEKSSGKPSYGLVIEFPEPEKLDAPCPKCKEKSLIATEKAIICTNKEKCDFFMVRTVAGVVLTENDVVTLLKGSKTRTFNNFQNKDKKMFSATLKYDFENLKITFEFANKFNKK